MVDCWYAIEKENGATDADAANVCLDKLGEKMLEMKQVAIERKPSSLVRECALGRSWQR